MEDGALLVRSIEIFVEQALLEIEVMHGAMDLLKSMPERTVGATWPTFYKPEACVLLLYVTAIGTNLN